MDTCGQFTGAHAGSGLPIFRGLQELLLLQKIREKCALYSLVVSRMWLWKPIEGCEEICLKTSLVAGTV